MGMGHPVQAMLKSFTALSGCASRGTSNLPQEVHIINLRGQAAEGQHKTLAEVSHPLVKEVELELYPLPSPLHKHIQDQTFSQNSEGHKGEALEVVDKVFHRPSW